MYIYLTFPTISMCSVLVCSFQLQSTYKWFCPTPISPGSFAFVVILGGCMQAVDTSGVTECWQLGKGIFHSHSNKIKWWGPWWILYTHEVGCQKTSAPSNVSTVDLLSQFDAPNVYPPPWLSISESWTRLTLNNYI